MGAGGTEGFCLLHTKTQGRRTEGLAASKFSLFPGPFSDSASRPSTPPSKAMAFEEFKKEQGSMINCIFKENKAILNERSRKASEVTQRINTIKREIDETKEALEFQKSLGEKQGMWGGEVWPGPGVCVAGWGLRSPAPYGASPGPWRSEKAAGRGLWGVSGTLVLSLDT